MNNFFSHQEIDQPLTFAEFDRFQIAYLYQRSSDSLDYGAPSQDYLAWEFDPTNQVLGFAVCDGVDSSFISDIAAKFLGDRLIHKLIFTVGPELENEYERQKLSNPQDDVEQIYTRLRIMITKLLNQWAKDVDIIITNKELPPELPPIVKTALEEQRIYGSETIFVCGRMNFQSQKILLVWMGDAKVQIFSDSVQIPETKFKGRWENKDRWSSKFGVNKKDVQVHVWVGDMKALSLKRIIVFSDGFSFIEDRIGHLNANAIIKEVDKSLDYPQSDDISYIDITLK